MSKIPLPILLATGVLGGSGGAATSFAVSSPDSITPTLGSELYTKANAASDPNGNEADATTGWSVLNGATIASQSTDKYAGNFALTLTAGTGTYGSASYALLPSSYLWHRTSLFAKQGVGNNQSIYIKYALRNITLTTSWDEYVFSCSPVFVPELYARLNAGAAGDTVLADNISCVGLTDVYSAAQNLSSALSYQQVGLTVTNYSSAGLLQEYDDNNYVITYVDRLANRVYLNKVIGGTKTEVANATITYSAGAILKLNHPAANQWVVSYGGTEVINDSTITDADLNAAKTFRLFATDSGTTFANWEGAVNP